MLSALIADTFLWYTWSLEQLTWNNIFFIERKSVIELLCFSALHFQFKRSAGIQCKVTGYQSVLIQIFVTQLQADFVERCLSTWLLQIFHVWAFWISVMNVGYLKLL